MGQNNRIMVKITFLRLLLDFFRVNTVFYFHFL